MHRSLQALQYYTSHSEEDIQRLHERIRASLASTESLTDTIIRLTGQEPLVPFKQDAVTADEWTAFLAGKHHSQLSDFYGILVARPILKEDGPLIQKEEKEIVSTLSRTYRETEPSRQKNKVRIEPRVKRKIPWGWLVLLVLCFLLGAAGTYVYSNYLALPATTEPKSTIEQPVVVEKSKEKIKDTKAEEKEVPNILYVKTSNTNIYSDSGLTDILYEADFGDGYRILETTDTISKIEFTDELTGYIKTVDTTKKLKEDPVADESLLMWVENHLDTSFANETLIDLIGKSKADLNIAYGKPNRTYPDKVNVYLFYGTHFFTLQNDKVIAIDWSETTITNSELATLAPLQLETKTTGLVMSNSYRLQRFEKVGTNFSRVRLAEQNL